MFQASQEEFEDDWDEADISDKKKVFPTTLWDWSIYLTLNSWVFIATVDGWNPAPVDR